MTLMMTLVVFEGAAAIGALKWALPRSNRLFFSIFVGDALFKMTGLALVTWWLCARHLPYTGPLLTLGGAYLLLSFAQIPFFYQAR